VERTLADATVLVVGLGDLGARVLDVLSRLSGVAGRLVGATRNAERGAAVVGQAQLVSALSRGPRHVEFAGLDLRDEAATAALLERVDPDVVIMCAAEHTWWRRGPSLPYAAWLPLQAPLVRRLMRARQAAGVRAIVVCLPNPDVVGPVLAPAGLAPDLGAGNVAEVAAKLGVLASTKAGEEVEVRLVLHHAAERVALGAFSRLDAAARGGEPPWTAEVRVNGQTLGHESVDALFRAPHPLLSGRATHALTAASVCATVRGLLSDEPLSLHVPAPNGRPGGYPVRLSRARVELDLPDLLSEADAVAMNARAAAWDGLERVEPDGTAILTAAAAELVTATLGLDLSRMAPDDLEQIAAEVRARLGALRR
jgi:hypothetical protein